MTSELLINVGIGEIRVARVVDGRLEDYAATSLLGEKASRAGDIILGRVRRVVPAMQAAFVEIGRPRAGFLALREAQSLAGGKDAATISDCVRDGEAVLVQVIKESIGEKGPRLSAAVTLPGRFLVMTPGQPGVAVSRRIQNAAQRAALAQMGEGLRADPALPPDSGFILRTVAQGASPDALTKDARALAALWRGISETRKTAKPPTVLHRDLGPVERVLRDTLRDDGTAVLIDDAATAEAARDYCRHALPGAEAMIELVQEDLFARHELEDQIALLCAPRVPLACGGWITLEATEALTAIDVNSGSYLASGGREDTSLAVNLEAAAEIGRQILLRGIGGLIVVDFIQLGLVESRARVMALLEQSLARDPVEISALWDLGLVVLSRKRVRDALTQRASEDCPTCGGTGHIPTAENVGQQILRRLEREARAWPGRELVVTAAPKIVAWLEQQDAGAALARHGLGRVRFEAGVLAREAFDVRPV